MTLSETDYEEYQSTIEDFQSQPTPDDCLPTGIKNILDNLADRKDIGKISYSLSTINKICEYRKGLGARTQEAPERIADRIEEHGYTAKAAINAELSELANIAQASHTSYPLVELDPTYFDEITNFDFRGGRDGMRMSHIIVVFKINTDNVLYFDPYKEIMERSSRVDEAQKELSRSKFYELWSGRHQSRWMMWIEERSQTRLDDITHGAENE